MDNNSSRSYGNRFDGQTHPLPDFEYPCRHISCGEGNMLLVDNAGNLFGSYDYFTLINKLENDIPKPIKHIAAGYMHGTFNLAIGNDNKIYAIGQNINYIFDEIEE